MIGGRSIFYVSASRSSFSVIKQPVLEQIGIIDRLRKIARLINDEITISSDSRRISIDIEEIERGFLLPSRIISFWINALLHFISFPIFTRNDTKFWKRIILKFFPHATNVDTRFPRGSSSFAIERNTTIPKSLFLLVLDLEIFEHRSFVRWINLFKRLEHVRYRSKR